MTYTLATAQAMGAKCKECPLKGRPLVPPVGPKSARLAIVGEAPGWSEAHSDPPTPFIGPSGRMLNRLLTQNKLDREKVHINNAALCLEGMTSVRLANGSAMRINEMVKTKFDGEVLAVQDGRLVPARVVGWYRSPRAGRRTLSVSFAHGRENPRGKSRALVTEDHTFLTPNGWVAARDLEGELVATGARALSGDGLQILIGTLLGDAHLTARNNGFGFSHAVDQEEYAQLKISALSELRPRVRREPGRGSWQDKIRANFAATPWFAALRERFYPNGEKRLPRDVEFTDLMIAIWYMDDGCMSFRLDRDGRLGRAEICASSLPREDIEFAVAELTKRGLLCKPSTGAPNRILFNQEQARALSRRIARFVPPSMDYKLAPEDRGQFDPSIYEPSEPVTFFDKAEVRSARSPEGSAVYCIDVEGAHNFVTLGGVAHNCYPAGAIKAGSTSDEMDPKAIKIAMKCCRPRLIRELSELKKLTTIAPLGAVAVRSLTNRATLSILKARGFIWDPVQEFEKVRVKKILKDGRSKLVTRTVPSAYAIRPSIRVLPTLHPAFVLRAPNWNPVIEFDFERIARAVRGSLHIPKLKIITPKTHGLSSPTAVRKALGKLGDVVSVDVETTKEAATVARLLCVGVSDGKRSVVVPYASTHNVNQPWYNGKQGAVMRELKRALMSRHLITQNGPGFDQIVTARYGIELTDAKSWDDTLLASHTYVSHMPLRLDHIVSMYMDMFPWKITAKRSAKTDEKGAWDPEKLADEELHLYNGWDGITKIAWDRMQDDLEPELSVYDGDKRLALLCRGMQERGFAIDNERRVALRTDLAGREAKALSKLRSLAKFPELKATKVVDIREALFERLGAPVLFRSVKTKAASTGADTLQALAAMDSDAGEFCRQMIKWREAQKLRSTYIDGIKPESDGRVHPSWKSFGTKSGRFSCREPNLQNLKRGDSIRSMYVAPKNRIMIAFDFSQLEMRMAAYLSGDEEFIRSCESEDIHTSNGVILFEGMPPKYLSKRDERAEKTNPEYKKLRDMAKESGFAVAYLAEPETVHANMLKKGFHITLIQVRAMLNRMRERYRRYYEWQESNLRYVQENGYLRTWDGRFSWFGFEPKPTEVCNRPIQGGAAALMNRVLPAIEDALPRRAFLIAQVHDAGYIEADPSDAPRIVRTCKRIAEAKVELPNGTRPTFPIDIKTGMRWSELG